MNNRTQSALKNIEEDDDEDQEKCSKKANKFMGKYISSIY